MRLTIIVIIIMISTCWIRLLYDITNCQNRGLSHLLKPKAEADNTDTRLDNSGYQAKTEFNECFIITFLKQSAKENTSLWVRKNLRTLHGRGAWRLGRLWTRHDNPTSAANIGLSWDDVLMLDIDTCWTCSIFASFYWFMLSINHIFKINLGYRKKYIYI